MKIADLKLTSVQSRIGRGMAVGLMLMCSAQLGSLDAAISFPAETWTESTPDAESMDAATLGELAETLGGRGLIIRNGRIVKSWGTYQRRGDWFGASYPLASTVLFFALDEGRIKSVHENVETRGWALDSVDRGINFHQLANLTSGYSRPEPPGAAWSYDSLGMRLYQMTLFDRVYNAPPISVLLQGDRLGPLQFEDRPVIRDQSGTFIASCRDFARVAWFWCQHGKWGEEQLLPAHYFERYARPQVAADTPMTFETAANDYMHIGLAQVSAREKVSDGPGIFGFGWWFNAPVAGKEGQNTWPNAPKDTFMAIGWRGNVAVMIPSLNLVMVTAYSEWGEFSAGDATSVYNERLRSLVKAVK